MPGQLFYLLAFIISLIVVLIYTPIVNRIGRQTGYVDKPDPRKIHKRPMVRLGGVAIFFGFVVAIFTLWIFGAFGITSHQKEWELWGILLGSLGFFWYWLGR